MPFSILQRADAQDSKATKPTFEEVENALHYADCMSKDIMHAVQLMILTVLPGIICAVREKENILTANIFDVVEDRISKIKACIDNVSQRHVKLQHQAHYEFSATEYDEPIEACNLPKDETSAHMEGPPDSPRSLSSTEYASSDDGGQSSDDEFQSPPPDCNSKSSLRRASRLTQTVEEIARAEKASWCDLDEVLQQLIRMKHHSSCLVESSNKSENIRARLEQRLDQFANAWTSLGDSCKQHDSSRRKSMEFMRDVSLH